MTQSGGPSPRDVQDIIQTRMAGEMQPVPLTAGVETRPTEPDAATLPATAAPSEATRPSTAAGSRSGSQSDAPTLIGDQHPSTGAITGVGTGRVTGTITRLGRTRTNANLPHDTQQLDLKLQLSRPSVLADLGKVGGGAIPPGVQKLIDEHGTEGRYAVEKPLAQGGMGAVLLIKDGDFQRPAAMKVMLSRFAQSPEAMERFLAEAQVTAQLEHPNIVPIHDLGIMEDGTVYFTMKFIEGESLGGVVKRLKSDDAAVAAKARAEWPDERILLTFLKVLDGMSYAHAKGVVHRDIKPDNIMLGHHGEVLVVDWGIAKVLGRDERGSTAGVVHLRDAESLSLTREGSAMGTLYYMPPEQARGELTAIDARSDIYSLGATLYELLTLKRPVSGGTAADIIAKVVNGELVPILEARPGLDQDLASVVAKMLAFQPERRYQRCHEVADDLRRFLAGQAVLARRRNLIERAGAWIARNKRQVAIGAGVAALVAVSAVGATWQASRQIEAQRDAQVAKAMQAAAAGDWKAAYDAAVEAGETRPAALAIKEQAATALALAAKAREDAARSEADRATAARLTGEARSAAEAKRWQEARDKAKAALEAAPLPEAQDLLATATAALKDARKAELEATAAARKADGDAALATARALDPLDPGLAKALADAREAYAKSAADGIAVAGADAAMAELGLLQGRADAAQKARAQAEAARDEAAKRRKQADDAIAAADTALAAGGLDAANEQISAARKLAPGDERAEALRERIQAALRTREAARAGEAARATARASAAEALARARAAEQAMLAAAADHAARSAEAQRLERELTAQPLEGKAVLVAARDAAQAARARVAEQWALAEGAARSAADALAGEPAHADALAANALLISLYRGRLDDARRNGALPEIAAFTNLLRRLGVDVTAPTTGTLLVDGSAVEVRRLAEDGNGRLVAVGPALPTLAAATPGALPQDRYELRAGDEVACVQVRPGAATRLRWAPAARPKLPAGMRLRWVPSEPGFWLAEDEVTVKQYAIFLADPAVAERLRASWKAWKADTNALLALIPRQGSAPDEAVWQLDEADDLLNSWRPHKDALAEPVRGVSRDDALAYCRWLAQQSGNVVRLPTLAEWRFAATGGDERRVHPWGPGFDHALASSAMPPKTHPPAVGSAASDRGPFGHRDLAGSVREWVSDPGLVYDARIAGGAWTDEDPARLRSDSVESLPASASFNAIGFRILVQP